MAEIDRLRSAIEHLAAIDRASCSAGEHEAAEWIAAALEADAAEARVEHEQVHGTYWWPLGLASALGAVAGLATQRSRPAGAGLAAVAAAAVVDDLGVGRRWLRRLLAKQPAANVIAVAGDHEGEATLVLVAHHDAAHSGFFFNPKITAFVGTISQPKPGAAPRLPPVMLPLLVAPAAVGLAALAGARRAALVGAAACAGIIASLTDIALRPAVPGANDNLSGVATLLGVARALKERPVSGLRVMLVSTGAEEALMEGMRAFAARHFPELDPERTRVLCVDTVGSPRLVLSEAEGMLTVRPYDRAFNDLIAGCASAAGIGLTRGMRMRLGTDGYVALRHGFPAAMLTSVDQHGAASNYHWPTDTPDRLDYARLADAVALCEAVARRLADDA